MSDATDEVPVPPAGLHPAPPAPLTEVPSGPIDSVLGALVAELLRQQATLATAESLTGGLVGAALTDVPGVSAVFRGGVVVYATDLKTQLAGVPEELLDEFGPVHPRTAAAMASGVRDRLGATYGLSTTGVAGPDPQDGHLVGEVYIGAAGPDGVRTESLRLGGGRPAVRTATVHAVLTLALETVSGSA